MTCLRPARRASSPIGLRQFVSYLLLYYFLLNNFYNRPRRKLLLQVFLGAVGVIALIAIYQYLYGFSQMKAQVPYAPEKYQMDM